MRTAFSYYGGKGMLVTKYPPPKYKKIKRFENKDIGIIRIINIFEELKYNN